MRGFPSRDSPYGNKKGSKVNIATLVAMSKVFCAIFAIVEVVIVARHGLTGFITWYMFIAAIGNILFLVTPDEKVEDWTERWIACLMDHLPITRWEFRHMAKTVRIHDNRQYDGITFVSGGAHGTDEYLLRAFKGDVVEIDTGKNEIITGMENVKPVYRSYYWDSHPLDEI